MSYLIQLEQVVRLLSSIIKITAVYFLHNKMKDALLCRHPIILWELPIFGLQKPSPGSLYCLQCPYV